MPKKDNDQDALDIAMTMILALLKLHEAHHNHPTHAAAREFLRNSERDPRLSEV